MKSIMQEATSVLKAIEKAWFAAGKPLYFTVKIFEEPEKNFLGMTTKSAKVGIFFDEIPAPSKSVRETVKPRERFIKKTEEKEPVRRIHVPEEPLAEQPEANLSQDELPKEAVEPRVIWSDEMIANAQSWLTQAINALGTKVNFTTDAQGYYLRFEFNGSVVEDSEKERQLFRSLSFLLLQALKKMHKRPLRGFKVVLTRSV